MSLSLPAPIATGGFLQPGYTESMSAAVTSYPADQLVAEITSYTPPYSKIVIKQGMNPIPPPNSVIISKTQSSTTGLWTIRCGVRADGQQPGVNTAAERAEHMAILNTGSIWAQSNTATQAQAEASGLLPDAVNRTTFETLTSLPPKSPLDTSRALGASAASITQALANQTSIRSFSGVAGGAEAASSATGGLAPVAAPASSPTLILQDEPPSDYFWPLLICTIVLVIIVAAAWHNRAYLAERANSLVARVRSKTD